MKLQAQMMTGITTVANTDAIKTCKVDVLSVRAQTRVMKYKDTKRTMPMMAKICFVFFMNNLLCGFLIFVIVTILSSFWKNVK